MRQIKFRGKRLDNGEWVYGAYHYSNDGKYHYICAREKFFGISPYKMLHDKEVWQVDPITVCEFIRTDMYGGVKIDSYVGDIVIAEMPYAKELMKGEIFYDEFTCAFRIKLHKENGIYIDWLTVTAIRNIIGNIHDNPELLTNQ